MAMTEELWRTSDIPAEMIRDLLRRSPTTRKLRLFAIACCRRSWDRIPTAEARRLVEVLEEYVEKRATWRQVLDQRKLADRAYGPVYSGWPGCDAAAPFAWAAHQAAGQSAMQIAHAAECATPAKKAFNRWRDQVQGGYLRDIFGNPFRPVALDPSWRTSTAKKLARSMYDSRDFAAMPILADALEDAGCDAAELLAHCRDPKAVHVRGCWAVDLVLSKS